MWRRFLIILACLAWTIPVHAQESYRVDTPGDTLSLRLSPGGELIAKLDHGAIVRGTGRRTRGWIEVSSNQQTGWVSGKYLVAVQRPPEEENASPVAPHPIAQELRRRARTEAAYLPVFRVGPRNARHQIVFAWSAADEESLAGFRQHINPLLRRMLQGEKDVSISFMQIITPVPEDANGPGGFLMCAKSAKSYAAIAYAYLLASEGAFQIRPMKAKRMERFFENDALVRVIRDNRIDANRCQRDAAYQSRSLRTIGLHQAYIKRDAITLPEYVVDQVRMKANDSRLQKLADLAGQK